MMNPTMKVHSRHGKAKLKNIDGMFEKEEVRIGSCVGRQ